MCNYNLIFQMLLNYPNTQNNIQFPKYREKGKRKYNHAFPKSEEQRTNHESTRTIIFTKMNRILLSWRIGLSYLNNRIKPNVILGLFILFGLAFHFIAYTGHFGYDDLHYAKLASGLNNGIFDAGDHYSFRSTILLLTALMYKLFGVNDFASSLPALLLFIGIQYIVFSILKKESKQQLILGLSLTTFSQSLLFYSDKLMPDIYVAFSVILAMYAFWLHRYHRIKKDILFAFIMVFALFTGFLSKGTIVLVIPLFLYLFIVDLILKRSIRFWIYSWISGLLLLLVYVLTIWAVTGNPLQRFQALESNAYLSMCSYGDQPISMLTERISIGFISLLLHKGMLFGIIFILAYFMQKLSLDILRFNTSFSFFIISSAILILSSNFMSISTESYNPMCLDSRHYLFIIPVIAIPASRIIYHFSKRRYLGIQILVLLLLTIISSYSFDKSGQSEIYALLFFICAINFLVPSSFKKSVNFTLTFFLILLIIPLQMIFSAQEIKYYEQKEIVRKEIIEKLDKAVIVTDDIQKRLGDYYLGFNQYADVKFESFKTFEWNNSGNVTKYLLINPYTSYISKHEMPFYSKAISATTTPLISDSITEIALYNFHEIPKKQRLIYSTNDFEKEYNFWHGDSRNKSDRPVFSGSFSNNIPEFSSSFEYVFDSVYNKNPKTLIVDADFNCLLKVKNQAQLIVVLEKGGDEYHREIRLFNHFMKSIDHWWPVNFEIFINNEIIKPDSKLIIYLWNPNKKEMYIDDFKIEVSTLL